MIAIIKNPKSKTKYAVSEKYSKNSSTILKTIQTEKDNETFKIDLNITLYKKIVTANFDRNCFSNSKKYPDSNITNQDKKTAKASMT